jgi:predicted nuclease of predicted toxin-antitoxin system
MRLLLDESISHRITQPLRATGHDVVHVAELSMLGANDVAVLERAVAERRTLVTADTDFGTLLALSGATQPGVIQFRRESHRPEQQLQFLVAESGQLEEPCKHGCVVTVTDGRLRLRSLPIQP